MAETGNPTATREPGKNAAGASRGLVGVVAALVVVACGAVFGYLRITEAGTESTNDAVLDADRVVVSSMITGRIVDMAAAEGDPVARGDLLVRLDDRTLAALRNEAVADIESSRARDALSQVKLGQAQDDLGRAQVQLREGVISKQGFDDINLAQAAAKTEADITEAQVRLAQAGLAVNDSILSHAFITSPTDALVARQWLQPGDVVQPAQPLYTLYDLANLQAIATFKENQIRKIRVGEPARITVDAFPGLLLVGRVKSVGAAADAEFSLIPPANSAGNYTKVTARIPVTIAIDRPSPRGKGVNRRLLPGMSVEVRVFTSGD